MIWTPAPTAGVCDRCDTTYFAGTPITTDRAACCRIVQPLAWRTVADLIREVA